jgi:hypothetical protein
LVSQKVKETAPPSETLPGGAAPTHRTLKLVLTLTPTGSGGHQALLAVGADGCDPLLRSIEIEHTAEALAEMVSLIEVAEAHWQVQPRNPAVSKKTGATTSKKQPPPLHQREAERPTPETEESDAELAHAGQLQLFD